MYKFITNQKNVIIENSNNSQIQKENINEFVLLTKNDFDI